MKNPRNLLTLSTSALAVAACLIVPGVAQAQTAGAPAQPTAAPAAASTPDVSDEVVVTGIRASLERSIAIKRDSTGVVDAISAEDMGKFPDTNLAESLQRITGVSINRRNGEGAEVTVRGFGPDYNLVTLNGRQLAASDQTAVGGPVDFKRNTSRSFDFSNLASEGVKTLEVYKTGRAAIPSGGIGATINVVTRRPLDNRESGFNGSIGVKADYDTSADQCIKCGAHVTPQVSGVLSWSNADQTFGASLFGSYQKRNFSRADVTVNGWNVTTVNDFLNPSNNHVSSSAQINNKPADGNALVARPDDARYQFAEDSNERINAQASLQWKPTDKLTLTADGLFAQNIAKERSSDESNWFNQNFDVVTFDSGHSVYTPAYLHETISGAQKDAGAEQQYRAQKNRLNDFGLHAKWELTDNFEVNLDGHTGLSKSTPDNPNGVSSTLISLAAPTLYQHSWDYSHGFPTQTVVYSDPVGAVQCGTAVKPTGCTKGNANGKLDVGDLGSQVGRQVSTRLSQRIKEGRVDFGWKLGGESRFDFGTDYRTTSTHSVQNQTYQTLGNWSNDAPRDVAQYAPGLVNEFCLVCKFTHYDPKATGDALLAFRTEDPTTLYNKLSAAYTANGSPAAVNGFADDRVKENIWAVYGQVTWKGQLGDHDASLVAGARYERTKVKSVSLQSVPTAIIWQSDNDFIQTISTDFQPVPGKGKYDNLLPSMDFQINLTQNLIGRFSVSRTISRPSYGDLFASTTAGNPNDATSVGGSATGNAHNPNLQPLTSDNFDLSVEWYFKPSSYLSAGFFEKRVHNFIGNTIVNRSLFGLRDPSSGAAGSRSGIAKAQLTANGINAGDVNLFTYTSLLVQNGGNVPQATATFLSHYDKANQSLDSAFQSQQIQAVDIIADSNDPLFNFAVNTPINNKDAKIHGFEVAGQYFFGHTGIGVAAAYTYVRGNIGIDVTADPTANLFALLGLSDTANATLIYDKHGISARVSYNWRAKYLDAINNGSSHNPEFTKAHGQVDANLSYDITPHLAVSLEGINIFEKGLYQYARSTNQVTFAAEASARYLLGVRFRF
ncbi:MAG: TonB-dependent receptor [Sphingomonas sp.]|nr:TonB-dependent receptor [Sphingomonas sp.]